MFGTENTFDTQRGQSQQIVLISLNMKNGRSVCVFCYFKEISSFCFPSDYKSDISKTANLETCHPSVLSQEQSQDM